MRTFCTIITSNYFPYAATLYRSLLQLNNKELLHILVCDEGTLEMNSADFPGIKINRLNDIYGEYRGDEIISKYVSGETDTLRWALKPVFINYLLGQGYEKVIFSDCDLYFVSDYELLFSELNLHQLILTPGRTTTSPYLHEDEFLSGFKYGQFNAGLIGANRQSREALHWWADCCSYKVETNFEKGLFVDQKYLDALPVLFENIGIIRHRGCNIAFWNQHECKRVLSNGKLLINGEYPVVFIHFTNKYIPELMEGHDPLIYPFYLDYEKLFRLSGKEISEFIPGMPGYKEAPLLLKIKRKLLLRTRIKRWLYKLSRS